MLFVPLVLPSPICSLQPPDPWTATCRGTSRASLRPPHVQPSVRRLLLRPPRSDCWCCCCSGGSGHLRPAGAAASVPDCDSPAASHCAAAWRTASGPASARWPPVAASPAAAAMRRAARPAWLVPADGVGAAVAADR